MRILEFGRLEFLLNSSGLCKRLDKNQKNKITTKIKQRKANTLNIFNSFIAIANELYKKNITFIPLKGLHLNLDLYKDFGLRPIRDIDLLIKKEDLKQYLSCLYDLGFKFKDSDISIDELFLSNYHYDIPVLVNKAGIHVETHLRVIDRKFNSFIFKDVIQKKFGNVIYNFMSYEDLLIHIIFHATTKNGFDNGLVSIFDVYNIISKKNINYKLLFEKAAILGMKKNISLMLLLLKNRFHYLNIDTKICNEVNLKLVSTYEDLIFINNSNYFIYKLISQNNRLKALSLEAYISEFGTKKFSILKYSRRLLRVINETLKALVLFAISRKYRKDALRVKSMTEYLNE